MAADRQPTGQRGGPWRDWRWMLAILLALAAYNALAILVNLYSPGTFRWHL